MALAVFVVFAACAFYAEADTEKLRAHILAGLPGTNAKRPDNWDDDKPFPTVIFPGVENISAAARAWASSATSTAEKKKKCEKIAEALTAAANSFFGKVFDDLRIFAKSCKDAAEKEDEAALDKALSAETRFIKAVGKLESKIHAKNDEKKLENENMVRQRRADEKETEELRARILAGLPGTNAQRPDTWNDEKDGAFPTYVFPGVPNVSAAAHAWASSATSTAEKKAKCEKIAEELMGAATPDAFSGQDSFTGQVFTGLRLFAKNCKEAAEKGDEAALDKALSAEPRFIKAVGKLESKILAKNNEMKLHNEEMAIREAAEAKEKAAASEVDDDKGKEL